MLVVPGFVMLPKARSGHIEVPRAMFADLPTRRLRGLQKPDNVVETPSVELSTWAADGSGPC